MLLCGPDARKFRIRLLYCLPRAHAPLSPTLPQPTPTSPTRLGEGFEKIVAEVVEKIVAVVASQVPPPPREDEPETPQVLEQVRQRPHCPRTQHAHTRTCQTRAAPTLALSPAHAPALVLRPRRDRARNHTLALKCRVEGEVRCCMCSPTLLLRACTLTLATEPGSPWIPPPSTRHLHRIFNPHLPYTARAGSTRHGASAEGVGGVGGGLARAEGQRGG